MVKNIKYIAESLNIKLFAFGIILGLITSIPELSLGINASIDGIPELSFGNLLGGMMVILGFVLGGSLMLNRQVQTDGEYTTLIPEILVIFSPIILSFDGSLNPADGFILIFLYVFLILYLYKKNNMLGLSLPTIINRKEILKASFFSLLGIILVLTSAHFLVETTLKILSELKVSTFFIGIVVFALGTNLPEITIMVTSWRKKAGELSLSHLLSSVFSNVLILGIVSIISPIFFEIDKTFLIFTIFLGFMLVFFAFFYHSDKKMERKEGVVLFLIYILFLITNFVLL